MQTTPCSSCGCVPQTVAVPGNQGVPGSNGQNAFSLTDPANGGFSMPDVGSGVALPLLSTTPASWMAIGQIVFVQTAGYFTVLNTDNPLFPVVTNTGYIGNVISGTPISPSQKVSPGGVAGPLANPLTIALGGTNSTTKAAAQSNLGLGQNAVISTVTGLTQAITASYAQVGACAVSLTTPGVYLITGFVRVLYNGVTFASSRVISAKTRDTTSGVDISVTNIDTGVLTTTSEPDADYQIPFTVYTVVTNPTAVQILITINTINSAGNLQVTTASLTAILLRAT